MIRILNMIFQLLQTFIAIFSFFSIFCEKFFSVLCLSFSLSLPSYSFHHPFISSSRSSFKIICAKMCWEKWCENYIFLSLGMLTVSFFFFSNSRLNNAHNLLLSNIQNFHIVCCNIYYRNWLYKELNSQRNLFDKWSFEKLIPFLSMLLNWILLMAQKFRFNNSTNTKRRMHERTSFLRLLSI